LWTIGHGKRETDELIGLLREYGITLLVDVRRYLVSCRHPQFDPPVRAFEIPDLGTPMPR
jgi:uncharacterized protein (DUF488 family)